MEKIQLQMIVNRLASLEKGDNTSEVSQYTISMLQNDLKKQTMSTKSK